MQNQPNVFVFILAGGSGERFWPLSRRERPKQLLRLFSEKTLLGEALERIKPLTVADRIFVLTNQQQRDATVSALPGFPVMQIIAEPAKRDTAPAAALATAVAYAHNPQAVVVLLPADHLIKNSTALQKNLRDASHLAADSDALITIAIPPTHPATSFGYLQLGAPLTVSGHNTGTQFRRVEKFVEKPDLATAARYVADGQHAWNAGMFIWSASTFAREASRSAPELAEFIKNYPAGGDSAAYVAQKFLTLPKISVDYAIMEKAENVIAAQSEFDWDDVGSWSALANHWPQEADGNIVKGQAVLHDSNNNIIVSDSGRTVALCGVSDLVVVETADSVLVCRRDREQELKKLLTRAPESLL